MSKSGEVNHFEPSVIDFIDKDGLKYVEKSKFNTYAKEHPEQNVLSHAFIQNKLKHLLGQTLTIIDTAIPQGKQNKSTKDLLKSAWIDLYVELTNEVYDPSYLKESEENVDINEITEVSTDEALGIED